MGGGRKERATFVFGIKKVEKTRREDSLYLLLLFLKGENLWVKCNLKPVSQGR